MMTDMQMLALVRFVEAMTGKTAASDEPDALAALYEAFGFEVGVPSGLPVLSPSSEKRRWSPSYAGFGGYRVVDQFGTPHTRSSGDAWQGTFEEARVKARELNRK